MRNILLLIGYDGTEFLGWQKTRMGPSIEETLQRTLEQILQEPISLQAASRTDAGVHAEGQVVQFLTAKEVDCGLLRHSLNALLPGAMAVYDVRQVPQDFHPTLLCQEKEYVYRCSSAPVLSPHLRWTTWHVPQIRDWEAMEACSQVFEGGHDFQAFCNQKKNESYESTIREVVSCQLEQGEDGVFLFRIHGRNFLYKMVRNIVGTLVDIGRGKIDPQELPIILEGKDRTRAGVTAPAHGLTLQKVVYPPEVFFAQVPTPLPHKEETETERLLLP